jgi:hypothetical protein
VTREGWSVFRKLICRGPFGHGVLSNIGKIRGSITFVALSRLSLSTGLRDLEERRRSPSGAEDEGNPPSGAEDGSDEAPSGGEGSLPPSEEPDGRNLFVVKGDRKVEAGPLSVGEGR